MFVCLYLGVFQSTNSSHPCYGVIGIGGGSVQLAFQPTDSKTLKETLLSKQLATVNLFHRPIHLFTQRSVLWVLLGLKVPVPKSFENKFPLTARYGHVPTNMIKMQIFISFASNLRKQYYVTYCLIDSTTFSNFQRVFLLIFPKLNV